MGHQHRHSCTAWEQQCHRGCSPTAGSSPCPPASLLPFVLQNEPQLTQVMRVSAFLLPLGLKVSFILLTAIRKTLEKMSTASQKVYKNTGMQTKGRRQPTTGFFHKGQSSILRDPRLMRLTKLWRLRHQKEAWTGWSVLLGFFKQVVPTPRHKGLH